MPDAAFYNLGDLLNTPTARLQEAPVTIVFDTTLDAVGENAGTLALSTFSTLLQHIRRGVHKLLGLGINEVHVVADHGFLLLEEVGEHEKAPVRSASALAVHERYLLGRGLGKTEQVAFPVPGSDDLIAWRLRGADGTHHHRPVQGRAGTGDGEHHRSTPAGDPDP